MYTYLFCRLLLISYAFLLCQYLLQHRKRRSLHKIQEIMDYSMYYINFYSFLHFYNVILNIENKVNVEYAHRPGRNDESCQLIFDFYRFELNDVSTFRFRTDK